MGEQGQLVIGTRVNLKQLEKDLSKVEKRLEETSKRSQYLQEKWSKVGLSQDEEQEWERKRALIVKLEKEYDRLNAQIGKTETAMYNAQLGMQNELKVGQTPKLEIEPEIDPNTEQKVKNEIEDIKKTTTSDEIILPLDTGDFTAQIEYIKAKIEELKSEYNEVAHTDPTEKGQLRMKELASQIEKLTQQYDRLIKKQQESNEQGGGINLEGLNKGMSGVLKKVAKWSLAVIGIRSVYLGIRQAMSTLSQYDKQLATDVEYIRYALANALKPIIEWIINAFYQILAVVGYIIKQITGKNIFDKAGSKQFKKDLDGASKSAKDIKKSLASFDEANILSDDKSAGGGGASAPSKDLAKMVDNFKPKDIQKIWDGVGKGIKKARKSLLDYQDELHNILNNSKAFNDAYGIWSTFVHGIGLLWAGVVDYFAGVWDTMVNFVKMFIDIITGDFDKLGEDFSLFITGIWEMFMGACEIIMGELEIILGAIIGVLGELAKWIWENLIVPAGKWFADLGKAIGQAFVDAWNWIKGAWGSVKQFFSDIGNGIANTFKIAVDKTKGFFSGLWNGIKNGAKNVANFIGSIGTGLKNGVKGIINFFIDGINKFIDGMNKIQWDVPDWVPFIGGQKWGINIPRVPRLASGGIINMPNRGVMVGSAIAGESGREGVLPLTDPNAMAQLGKEIGQWINIGIDNKMVVDGRVLATATQDRINKESFLMNR